jgi:hypothetical protein
MDQAQTLRRMMHGRPSDQEILWASVQATGYSQLIWIHLAQAQSMLGRRVGLVSEFWSRWSENSASACLGGRFEIASRLEALPPSDVIWKDVGPARRAVLWWEEDLDQREDLLAALDTLPDAQVGLLVNSLAIVESVPAFWRHLRESLPRSVRSRVELLGAVPADENFIEAFEKRKFLLDLGTEGPGLSALDLAARRVEAWASQKESTREQPMEWGV